MNLLKWVNLIGAAVLLGACAHQEAQLPPPRAHDMVVIPQQDLYSYWRSSNPSEGLPMLSGSGCVSIEMVIDSKGKVHDLKVLALSGPKELSDGMLSYYAGQHFYPVATNSERTPIKTTVTISYAEGRAAPDSQVAQPCVAQQGGSTEKKG